MVCSLSTSSGPKVENQSRSLKFNSSTWKKNSSKLIYLYQTLLSSLQSPSTKSTMTRHSTIGRLRLLLLLATSILSKSTFTLIWQVLLPVTKSLRSSIDMVSMKLKITSKHLMDILLLLKDYLLCCILSTGTANLYWQSMIPERDGLSTKLQAKMNSKLNTMQEPISLSFSCWEVTLWTMEDVPSTGTLLSQEIHQILSQD